MPRTFKRDCDKCGTYYEGYGSRFCSQECAERHRAKADAKRKAGDRTDPTDNVKFTEEPAKDSATAESISGRITSLDQLLDACNVDRDTWTVDRYTVNKWESASKDAEGEPQVVPLFQVKAYLKRIREAVDMKALAVRVVAEMEAHAPVYPAFPKVLRFKGPERHMLEVSPFDLHVGKLAWHAETGEDYDSKIAARRLEYAVDDLLRKASGFPVEQILFPIGNDLLHTDSPDNTTTRGTQQDVDSRHHKMFTVAEQLMVWAIDRLLERAPVKVIIVPGNHDRDNALRLGRVLAAWYRNTDRVEVDAGPELRKYVEYGTSLIGFTHGSEEKQRDLPLIMAQEQAEAWARTTCREFHVGHLHKRARHDFIAGDTFGGVVVRTLPSLTGTDAWHASKGYVKGVRAAEAYLWSYETGYAGHFSANVLKAA